MTPEEVITELKAVGNPENLAGMSRFGINAATALGIRIPDLRTYARKLKKNHPLALELWQTGIHEARLLACFIDDPQAVTEEQMERAGPTILIPGTSATSAAAICLTAHRLLLKRPWNGLKKKKNSCGARALR